MHKTAKYWKDKEDIIIKDGKNELNTSEHAKRFDSFGKNLFKSWPLILLFNGMNEDINQISNPRN